MKFWHCTPRRNLKSIMKRGILTKFHHCIWPCVWLVKKGRIKWAREHVAARHGVPLSDVRTIAVDIDVRRTVRTAEGLHRCDDDIAPVNILYVVEQQ